MKWQQLEYFKTIAELEHFTKASKRLFVSQPTLSRAISKLEDEIGVPLFERQGRSVKLNQFGQIFYERVIKAMKEIENGEQEILSYVDPNRGKLSIAFLKSLGSSTFPNMINSFLSKYPNVTFEFSQNSTNAMLNQLESGDINFCLSSITENRETIEWEHLWTEEVFAFVSKNHKLANQEVISLKDLSDEKFIALKYGYGLRAVSDRLFEENNIKPNIVFEGEESITIMGFVAANLGITLLPKIKDVKLTNVKRLRVSEPNCNRPIGLAWRKNSYLSPIARRFQAFALNYFNN